MKIIINNQSSASPRKALRILRDVLKRITRDGEFKKILSGELRRIEFAEDVRMETAGASGNILRVTMSDPTY